MKEFRKDTLMKSLEPKAANIVSKALVAFVIFGGLAGCGGLKTNPVADYPELKDSVPPHEQKARTQNYLEGSIFQLKAVDSSGAVQGSLTFVQGQETRYTVKSQLNLDGVEHELVASDLPTGASFARVSGDGHANEYQVSWIPSPNTLTDQEAYRPIKIQLGLKIKSATDERAAEIVRAISHPRDLTFMVVRNNEQPFVEKVEMPVTQVQEGEALELTVTVKDIGAGDRAPRLLKDTEKGASQESAKVDGANLVKFNAQPEALGGGRFRFTGRFDTKGVVLPGTDDLVPARFMLVVVSRSGLPGVDELVEIKIARKPKPQPVVEVKPEAEQKPVAKPATNGTKPAANATKPASVKKPKTPVKTKEKPS